ncbi:DUF2637 domain-containing protein [Streptomyces subrutilus]|uniref:DUF2637 domain-containing protein n=1 Tax=Streptomyces subrutilus TaxID=36818 RepID=UPI0034480ED6
MNETLTGGQGVAMAPATPATAPATPATWPGAPATREDAPPLPRKGGRGDRGEGGQGEAMAPATGHPAPATVATPQTDAAGAGRVSRLLAAAALIGMIPVAIIGFAASYTTVADKARAAGFAEWLAPWIPIGLDGAILGFLALDLYMTRRRTPWPLLRFAAHVMTAATVVINAAAGAAVAVATEGQAAAEALPASVRVFWHGLMPVLFVVGVEAARRLIVHAVHLEDGTATDSIPLHRWVLAPIRTPRLYRRMRLAVVRSYPEMVAREQALEGYRVWLTQQLDGDLSRATEVQLLPMTMAPRGYTVEEALALPAKWQAEAQERDRVEADRQRVEAERLRRQAKEDTLRALADDADVVVAEREQDARTGMAAAKAEAAKAEAESAAAAAKAAAEHRRTAAERQSRAEAEALESAEAAAARRRAAEDAAEAERAEAEAERLRAATAQAAALESVEAAAARRRAAQDAAEAERAEAEAERLRAATAQAAADRAAAEKAAAAAREETAMIEARIQQAEDYARLLPRERSERVVARMLLAAGVNPETAEREVEAVPLARVMETLSVKQTAAGDARKAAAALLESGYRPTLLESALDAEREQSRH